MIELIATSNNQLICRSSEHETAVSCAIGRRGMIAAADKREGDGASPIGTWPLRRVFYRADKHPRPKTPLTTIAITKQLGWCDAPDDANYNQLVTLPYPASHEVLWRDDDVYDLIVELGHNDNPPISGLGSAIFLHVAKLDYSPTEGCIAVKVEDLYTILRNAAPGSALQIML